MTVDKFRCNIHLEKSPWGDLNQLPHEVFRNLLSFKRNWFHFSNLNLFVFVIYTSFKGFHLRWSQSEEWRKEVSTVTGKRQVTGGEPSNFIFKSKMNPKCLLHPKILKMSFLLWTPVALSPTAVIWNLAYCFLVCHFNQIVRLFKAEECPWGTLQMRKYCYFPVHGHP